MLQGHFDQLLDRRIEATRSVLASKNAEYSSGTDRLHNFKAAAHLALKPITPEQALWGMLRKHLVSILDMVEGDKPLPDKPTRSEKIGDAINYLILLEALLEDRASAAANIGE